MKRYLLLLLLFPLQAFAAGGTCPAGGAYPNAGGTSFTNTLTSIGVTSCYFISSTGVDTATGTDESHPWLHAPGMSGCSNNCSSATISTGTGFIIQGGSTYHFSGRGTPVGLPWSWGTNGTGANPIYLGVDKTWFSGGSWARPVFTGDNPTSTSSGGVASCSFNDDGETFIGTGSTTHVITDNFEVTGICWHTGGGLAIFEAGTANSLTWTNNYIHGWTRTTGCTAAGCAEAGVGFDSGNGPDTGPGDPGWLNVYAQNVVDGTDSDNHILTAIEWQCYDMHGNVFNRYTNMVCAHHLSYDNQFTNTAQSSVTPDHGNVHEENGSVQNAGPNAWFSNLVANNANGVTIWLNPQVGSTDYVFNNVFWNNTNSGNTFDVGDPSGNIGSFVVFNQTAENPENGPLVNCQATAHTYSLTIANFHAVTDGGAVTNGVGHCSTTPTTSLVQTHATATTQGYTAAETFAYSPTLGSNSTVGAGTSQASICSTITSGGNTVAGSACLSDTAYACTYNGTSHSVACPARVAVARPATWDAGAYQFTHYNTFYIRTDGGTRFTANAPTGRCNGLADTADPGSGTNQACAFSDLRYMWDDGTFACANNCWAMSGGDTVIIRGCASGSTSTAPDCRIGSDTQTASGSIWCPGVGNAGCYNPPIPAGTAGQHTRILGQNYAACSTGTPGTIGYTVDKTRLTQLFGGWGAGLVLNLTGTQYVDVQCLQLWRHSQCIFFGSPANPAPCNRSFPSEDDYVDSAIATNVSTSNVTLQDMWIHGMLSRGVIGPVGGPITATRVDIDTNGGAGWDFDDGSATPFGAGASFTFNNSIIEWNGCNQEYPFSHAIPVASCYGQSNGGYGDGIGTPNANTGLNVSMNQSIFRYNTQDGFDFGHVENSGFTFSITNSVSYGNGGGALKWSDGFTSQTATGNLAIANCNRMQAAITGTPSTFNANLGDFCRSGDAIAINTKTGDTTLFANNTIITYAPTTFDLGCNDPTSCSTSVFKMFNNVVIGYDNPATYSEGGQAGGPGGYCLPGCNGTTHPITLLTTQYNDYYLIRTITCPTGNTGEICTSPALTSQPTGQAGGFVESQLDVYTAALTSNLIPTNGSPVTLAGTNCAGCATNDFNNNAFTSPHPIGAFNPAGIIVPPAASLDGASGFSGKVTTP